MKKLLPICTALMLGTSALLTSTPAFSKPLKVAVVVKIGGIPWFNAMKIGVEDEGKKLGIQATYIGPTSGDPALQVKAIEDLIAQKVDVIGVVPNDAKVLEPVLKKAREHGILVITHESVNQKNADYDFELIEAKSFGELYMKQLGEQMGGTGRYAVSVGSLTVPAQNTWCDSAIAYQKKHFPNMKLVVSRLDGGDSVDDSFNKMRDLLLKEPNLKGYIGFASQAPVGAGRAVMKAHRKGMKILGIWSPSQGHSLFKKKILTGGFMWNPMTAGRIFVRLAKAIKIDHTLPQNGKDIASLKNIALKGNTILVSQPEDLSKAETVEKLVKMGL